MGIVRVASRDQRPIQKMARLKGDAYIRYRRLWERSNLGVMVHDFPLHLDIEISSGCNLRCRSCIRSLPKKLKTFKDHNDESISPDTFHKIISEGIELGLCAITLNGNNEPLLKNDISEYINTAASAGILDVMLHTNANLLKPEMANQLMGSGLTAIYFSIDAFSPETYSKVRPGGDYRRVIENIHYFLGQKEKLGEELPITRVSFVETRFNTHELRSFVEYWEDKVDFVVSQNFVTPYIDMPMYLETERAFRIPRKVLPSPKPCPYPFQRLLIRNNGDVTYCCSWYTYGIILGNIYNQSIQEIWMGKSMQDLRNRVNGPESTWPDSCRKCRLAMVGESGATE